MRSNAPIFRAWQASAWIAGVFSILVGAVLLTGYVRMRLDNPLTSIAVADLKAQLREAPAYEPGLKEQIRQADFAQRNRYFRYQSRTRTGVYLLLAGVAALVLSTRLRAGLDASAPTPQPKVDDSPALARSRARWAVTATGAMVAGSLLVLAFHRTLALNPASVAALQSSASIPTPSTAPDFASPAQYTNNWPRFRGPNGNGWSPATNVPARWDVKTGEAISWKVPVPGPGLSSPIVWDDSVFVSAADASERTVSCLDARSGKTVWKQTLASSAAARAPVAQTAPATGYAAPTTATDGRRVYAIFKTGEAAGFTLDGKQLWLKNLGPLKNSYGHASSLATWRDRVIIQLDQGEPEDNKSKLYALNGATGEIVWQRPRKAGASWASPLVIESGGKAEVITLAVPRVISYAADTGTELWRADGINGEVTPSPAFAAGLVFAVSPSEKLFAIKPGGTGDVTKTHVAWAAEDGIPDITSPATDSELLFNLTSSGLLTCVEVKDGKKAWEHDFEMEFHASPAMANGKVYLFSQKGIALVVEAGAQFKELFRTEMADTFEASPAFTQNRIFLRGETNLWCLAKTTERLVSK